MTEYGTLEHEDGRWVLRFERRLSAPPDRGWRAITDPDEMKAWFPSNVEGDRAVGAELLFTYDVVDQDDPEQLAAEGLPLFAGRVLEFDPPRLFSFTWGPEVIRLELVPEGDGTRLVFRQILSHRSVAGRNGSGWHACLDALETHLGRDVAAADGFALYDEYVARMGIALGVPADDGSITWEVVTHVGPDRAREVIAAMAEWAGDHTAAPLRWDVGTSDAGTVVRVTHDGVGADPELAAVWHARLTQLDLYMAAGVFHPVAPEPWVSRYREVLGA